VSYHVYVFCPGNVEDVEAAKWAFARFIAELDRMSGAPPTGSIAGGDWIGNDRAVANAFELSAEEARAGEASS
jgi:hypothetical protein